MNPLRFMAAGLLSMCGSIAGVAWAQEPEDLAQVRAELAEVEAHFNERARACHQKLYVTACRQGVQAERSQALQPIQARLRAIEAAVRAERAENRRAQIRQRQHEHEARVGASEGSASVPVVNPAESK